MPNFDVTNQTELNTAFGSAVGGDTITFTSWSGGVTISGRSYASDVTLQGSVTVGSISISNSDHIYITGLTSEVSPGSTNCAFSGNSTYVTFDGVTFKVTGDTSFTTAADFTGSDSTSNYSILVNSDATCDNLTIVDCAISGTAVPIRPYNSDNVTIERCTFETVRTDCIKFGGSSTGINIIDNLFPIQRWFKYSAEHADCVQFVGSFSNIEIHGNVMLPQVNISTQGIFSGYPISNINITQNLLAVNLANGIAIEDGGTNQTVTNNTVICYFPPGGNISATQVYIASGTNSKNFAGTWKAANAGVVGGNIRLCSEGDAAASPPYRYWDQYQIAAGKQSAEGIRFALDFEDFDPVTDSLADYAAQGAGTYGAYDTISRIAANGYSWPPGAGTPAAPVITGTPSISGTEVVGATLMATPAAASGYPNPSTSWQWYNSVSGAIAGATSASYTLTSEDEGDVVWVVQTETNTTDPFTDTAQSANSGTIGAAVAAPTISNTSPADNATGVALDSQPYTITFNKNIAFSSGGGTIGLHRADGTPTLRQTWDTVEDQGTGLNQVSISGATLSITNSGLLLDNKDYWFEITDGAIEGTDGSVFGGISDSTTWNFSTSSTPAKSILKTTTPLILDGMVLTLEG